MRREEAYKRGNINAHGRFMHRIGALIILGDTRCGAVRCGLNPWHPYTWTIMPITFVVSLALIVKREAPQLLGEMKDYFEVWSNRNDPGLQKLED